MQLGKTGEVLLGDGPDGTWRGGVTGDSSSDDLTDDTEG